MTRLTRSAGAALISAIFLIIVLVALGAAMVSLSTVQQDTATKSLLASRVYYGAKAGLEWAIQRAIATGSCAGSATFTPAGTGFAQYRYLELVPTVGIVPAMEEEIKQET